MTIAGRENSGFIESDDEMTPKNRRVKKKQQDASDRYGTEIYMCISVRLVHIDIKLQLFYHVQVACLKSSVYLLICRCSFLLRKSLNAHIILRYEDFLALS